MVGLVLGGFTICALSCVYYACYRQCRNQKKVYHQLDEEELRFGRQLEQHSTMRVKVNGGFFDEDSDLDADQENQLDVLAAHGGLESSEDESISISISGSD
mmetsp:Transcript_9324/g.13704  ORF Transcript_9324/g.13704 Transcript_9324/m.13704 type:complete len:101 (-) Transcript_9324:14-316(-)|eukprot:CAMPEP_0175125366 /NCGR_PEP_ID=MMETSP0087-20121206/3278_1 /TAXON_ID=136419 /ORGANISM="Unknown Unknown, Strain D1" /LENGTH=100 /DNA_ID=CAMNT_0016407199 /DNA_START=9 /DNA_END=311 /DNA_ORIENTATION=-